LCREGTIDVFLDLGNQPLANALVPNGTDPSEESRYPLQLGRCSNCGLVQLTATVDPNDLFVDYNYASSYSDVVLHSAKALVDRLVKERQLGSEDLAIEIASNDGYLLRNYVEAGVPVLGIDPAKNLADRAREVGVATITEFFGEELAQRLVADGKRASVVHANNVLAHVPDINGVLTGIATVLRPDGVAVLESPWLRWFIENIEFDTTYHEHLFYYSLAAFRGALLRNGLDVVEVEELPIHGGTLRVYAMHVDSANPTSAVADLLALEHDLGLDDAGVFATYGDRVQGLGVQLKSLLTSLKSEGATIAAYGAAAKGAVLLNTFGIGPELIDFVADRSPLKQGQQMPGVAIPIVSPDQLVARKPDYTVILAWNHADEVRAQQSEYRASGGRFIVPLPVPRIVSG
jgi:SAM-dependent methyltransferase